MKRIPLLLLLSLLFSLSYADAISVRAKPLYDLLQHSVFSAPATVYSLNTPNIAAEINARIESIPVRIGDRVNKGDVLVRMDCRLPRSRLKANKAQLQRIDAQIKYADVQLRRAKNLKRKQSISDETLDQRRSELSTLNAERLSQQQQIRQAEIEVERCKVFAPFDALVFKRIAQEGSLASPGAGLLNLVQLDEVEVSARLNVLESASIQEASNVTFSYAKKEYPLKIARMLPVIDEKTRTQEVRLLFSQANAPIGAAGRVKWHGMDKKLSSDYLQSRNNQLGVFLPENGKAKFHPIAGAQVGQAIVVELNDVQLIVTEGRQRLQNGDSIVLVEEN